MKAIAPILNAYDAGNQFLLVSGRALHDLDMNGSGDVRPLIDTLSREAQRKFGMTTMNFDLAMGGRWNFGESDQAAQRQFIDSLRSTAPDFITAVSESTDSTRPPFDRAFRLFSSLSSALESASPLPPLLLIFHYAEDLARTEERGVPSDYEIQVSQVIQNLAADYRRRLHPLLVVLTGVPEEMNPKVVGALSSVTLPLPGVDEKLEFIEKLKSLPSVKGASYESGLDDRTMANLTARTPNSSLEQAFLSSSRTGAPVSITALAEKKRDDVVNLSEGTLQALDTERVRELRLAGRTIEKPLKKLQECANLLKLGDPNSPVGIILAGAPSFAKTDLSLVVALLSGTPAYQLVSPKGGIVGASERRVRLQFRVLKDLAPAFGVIDEVTEAFPMGRNDANLDSGASAAVTAELLTALSDSSRCGRNLIVATTNRPASLCAAMASRFLFVPVLSAVEEDYPDILCAIAERMASEMRFSPDDPDVQKAADLFWRKGATPRRIRDLLASKRRSISNGLDQNVLIKAAEHCAPEPHRNRIAAEYADLSAIEFCSDLELLPWYGRSSEFPFPPNLKNLVDQKTGEIDYERLSTRLEELKPLAHV